MKITNRYKYLALFFLFFFTVTVRYPRLGLERGIDTFFYHIEAYSIIEFQTIKWLIHPLSAFGLYPLSQEAGPIILLAEFANLSSFSMEMTIYLTSVILGILGTFGTYIFVRRVFNNFYVGFFSAYAYSSASALISFSSGNLSTRMYILALAPLIMLLYILHNKHHKDIVYNVKFLTLLASIILIGATIHRIFVLFIYIGVAYATARLLYIRVSSIDLTLSDCNFVFRNIWQLILAIGLLLLLAIAIFNIIPTSGGREHFRTDMIKGSHVFITVLNLSIEYAFAVGPLIVFALLGLLLLLRLRPMKFPTIFIVLSFLIFVPFLTDEIYIRPYLVASHFSLFIGFGVYKFLYQLRIIKIPDTTLKRALVLTVAITILSAALIPKFIIVRKNSPYSEKEGDSIYQNANDAGIYFNVNTNSDEGVLCLTHILWEQRQRFYASSRKYSFVDGNVDILINDAVETDSLVIQRREIESFEDLIRYKMTAFTIKDWIIPGGSNYYGGRHTHYLASQPVDSNMAREILSLHNVSYIILADETEIKSDMRATNLPSDIFANSLRSDRYLVFANEYQMSYNS